MADTLSPLPASTVTERPALGAHAVTVVLPWDLDAHLAAFPSTPAEGHLLVLESRTRPAAMPFHRQKLTLVASAVRHFVRERRALGFHVEHRVADDFATGVADFARGRGPSDCTPSSRASGHSTAASGPFSANGHCSCIPMAARVVISC